MDFKDIDNLNAGDWLLIEGKRYEAVYLQWDAMPIDGEYLDLLTIALHSEKSLALEPRDFLEFYPERELLIFKHRDERIRIDIKDLEIEKKSA